MPSLNSGHRLWPQFVTWHTNKYGEAPSPAIREHASRWSDFLAGVEAQREFTRKYAQDMGLVVNPEDK